MKKCLIVLCVCMVMMIQPADADRGSIPFKSRVKIFEPAQRAMIAWNGHEEVLILSTDMSASESTKVLEVLPLPSEPVVKKGDIDVFPKAVALINQKLEKAGRKATLERTRSGGAETPTAEVTFHKMIGTHDISVTHVLDKAGFIQWVDQYLTSLHVENPAIPEPLSNVITEYLHDGFAWFVFDVITLDEDSQTNEAIQYRFESDMLYYPLRITRTEEGRTTIQLFILTSGLLQAVPEQSYNQLQLLHRPVEVTLDELRDLDEELADVLEYPESTQLRIWEIHDMLSAFQKDLMGQFRKE